MSGLDGYCTDCENRTKINDGRCSCGSGRVIADAETPATPADVGEEPVAWRMRCVNPRMAKQPGYWVLLEKRPTSVQAQTSSYEIEPLYSATALERVVRERDEALRWAGCWHRICQTIATVLELPEPDGSTLAAAVRDKWNERVPADWYAKSNSERNAAEAKIAEARKVIAGWLSAEDQWDCTKGADDLVKERMSTARRFLEETK